ncbi:unnamed protein product, partial [Menidia menidia]
MNTRKSSKNLWWLYETEVPHIRLRDAACGASLAEKLSPEHLHILRNAFSGPTAELQTQPQRLKGRHENRGEEPGRTLQEFRELLKSVIGPGVEDSWIQRSFSEVDISCTGEVNWRQLCSYLLLEYTETQRASVPIAALLDAQPQFKHCSHNRREPTVRVVAVSHPPPLRYISVSKGGQITVWSSSLRILKNFVLAGDPTEEVANTRRFRGWTTDAVYMDTVHRVAIATDCRELHFINVNQTSVFEDIHLFGFHCVPTALCYWHDRQSPEQPPLLLLGDEKGGVHLMWFLNPMKGLFKNPSKTNSEPQRIFFPDFREHSNMVSYRHIPKIHPEPINRVMFEPCGNVIMTSSETDTTSVVFISVSQKQGPYIWKFKQGAKCFDYNSALQLLVTGGRDQIVRLWTRYVTTSPVATLRGHHATVIDVGIYQPVGQIFSYSRDCELRVWDISTHLLLKTVRLHFPCLVAGRIQEHGNFPFLLLSPPLPEDTWPHLIVGCKDYLACLELAEAKRPEGCWLTDEGSTFGTESGSQPSLLSCALYNPTLLQVVTGHVDSSVSLWDVKTGRKRLQILNAHGKEGITCMEFDSSQRRLITGAQNGTIKVWNLLNGLNLHKLEPVTCSEVTGLTCLHDNQLLAVGWSQRVIQYNIAGAKDLKVRADLSWKSKGVHKSDIMAVRQCTSLGVVATASYDGEVVIWRLETQGPSLSLQREAQEGSALPVDELLFLHHRAASRKLRVRSVLVSSQAGRLSFWSITGEQRAHARFYAPEQPGQRVLTLCSDQTKNSILVSGDTLGCLHMWDISSFALSVQREVRREQTETKPHRVLPRVMPSVSVQSACERPPLLRRWRAHARPLVCVELLEEAERLFVLTASADGAAGLWTEEGHHVGYFGQEMVWSITDPATYGRQKQSNLRDDEKEENGRENRGQTSTSPSETDHEQPQQPMRAVVDRPFPEAASS